MFFVFILSQRINFSQLFAKSSEKEKKLLSQISKKGEGTKKMLYLFLAPTESNELTSSLNHLWKSIGQTNTNGILIALVPDANTLEQHFSIQNHILQNLHHSTSLQYPKPVVLKMEMVETPAGRIIANTTIDPDLLSVIPQNATRINITGLVLFDSKKTLTGNGQQDVKQIVAQTVQRYHAAHWSLVAVDPLINKSAKVWTIPLRDVWEYRWRNPDQPF
jgi:hypothetical protein